MAFIAFRLQNYVFSLVFIASSFNFNVFLNAKNKIGENLRGKGLVVRSKRLV